MKKNSLSAKSSGGPKKPTSNIKPSAPRPASKPAPPPRPAPVSKPAPPPSRPAPAKPATPSRPAPVSKPAPPASNIKSSVTSQPPTRGAQQPAGPAKASVAKTGALSPEQQSKFDSAQSQWHTISNKLSFTDVQRRIQDTGAKVTSFDSQIADLRKRGYKFGQSWEARAQTLQEQWPQQQYQAQTILHQQQNQLLSSGQQIEGMFAQAAMNAAVLMSLEAGMNALQARLSSTESQVESVYGQTAHEARLLEKEIAQARFLLDALDTASFPLQIGEVGVAVCKAKWVSDRDQPRGRLFLTTNRIIFEQHEEIATKKVLFITTQKQLVQKLLWEAPVGAVDDMTAEDIRRFMARNTETLTLHFNVRTRELPEDVTLDLEDADNHTWIGLIRRVKEGRIDAEVVGTEAGAVLPEPKVIPTKCSSCGAQLPEVFRGMRTVSCDYCGSTTAIEY